MELDNYSLMNSKGSPINQEPEHSDPGAVNPHELEIGDTILSRDERGKMVLTDVIEIDQAFHRVCFRDYDGDEWDAHYEEIKDKKLYKPLPG